MNNIFGNFGGFGGCNKGCDNHCNIDPCWLIMLMMLCGCNNDFDPCSLIMFLLFSNCFCSNQNNNCCCNN